jgi:hypothetical protein
VRYKILQNSRHRTRRFGFPPAHFAKQILRSFYRI